MIVLTIALLLSSFFFGCASTPASKVSFETSIEYETDTPGVTLEIKPFWSQNFLYGDGFGGFICNFTNNTTKTAKIVWEESTLNYNGGSALPFIDGQKYSESTSPMAPTAIPKGSSINKDVYSSNQPNYTSGQYGGWSMKPIVTDEITLLFCIRTDAGEEYITATVKAIIAE